MDFKINKKTLANVLQKAKFEVKPRLANQLFCRREKSNELLMLAFDDNPTKDSTGLRLISIDLETLTTKPDEEEKEAKGCSSFPITYFKDTQSGSNSFAKLASGSPLLTDIDVPHKIFLNSNRENVLTIMSTNWIGIIFLQDSPLCYEEGFNCELQLIRSSDPEKIDKDEVFIDAKFHPLSPYTLCILNDRN